MVKNIFSNFSRGFFYTIGKIIAFVFIALVIGTILTKIDPRILDGLLMQVQAAEATPSNVRLYNRSGTQLLNGPITYNPNANVFYNVDHIDMPFNNNTLSTNNLYTFNITYDFFVSAFSDYGPFDLDSPELAIYSNGYNWQDKDLVQFQVFKLYNICSGDICTYRMNLKVMFTPQYNGSFFLKFPLPYVYDMRGYAFVSSDLSFTSKGGTDTNQIINNNNENTNNIIANNNQNSQNIINNQNENTEEIKDTLTNEDTPSENDINDILGDIDSPNHPLTNMINILLKPFVSFTETHTNCHFFDLGTLYGTELRIPCIDFWSIGDGAVGDIVDIATIFMCFYIYYNTIKFVINFITDAMSLEDVFERFKTKLGGGGD